MCASTIVYFMDAAIRIIRIDGETVITPWVKDYQKEFKFIPVVKTEDTPAIRNITATMIIV